MQQKFAEIDTKIYFYLEVYIKFSIVYIFIGFYFDIIFDTYLSSDLNAIWLLKVIFITFQQFKATLKIPFVSLNAFSLEYVHFATSV